MAEEDGSGWTYETLFAHFTAQLETLHHEVEGRESLWRKEYDAKIDGLRCHTDDHWSRLQAQSTEMWEAMRREDRNLSHRIRDCRDSFDNALRALRREGLGELKALRLYHDQSVAAQERAVRIASEASQKAIDKSEYSFTRQLEGLASFRGLGRDEFNAAHANLVQRVDQLQQRIDRAEGRGAGYNALWLIIVAAISTVGVIIMAIVLITDLTNH